MRFMHILEVMEAKSVEIFDEKKKALEDGKLFDDGPKDVIATLCESQGAFMACDITQNVTVRDSRAAAGDALEEGEILGQIQTMVFA